MSIIYNTDIVRDGLIAHYDFGSAKCYSGSGTNVTNLTGNSDLDGRLGNSPAITDGNLVITSRNQYLQIKNGSVTNWEHDFVDFDAITVEMLVRRDSVNNTGTGGVGQPSYYQGLFNYYWDGGHQIYVGTNSDASSTNLFVFGKTTTLSLSTWVHIVGITGPDGKRAFINGVELGSQSTGTAFGANKRIFVGNWDGSWATFCSINNFKMYRRALTTAEIARNFEAVRSRVGL